MIAERHTSGVPSAEVLDVIASRFTGPIKVRDVRVVWTNGTLYVCKSRSDIKAFSCEEPTRKGGYYQVMIDGQIASFQLPGCGTCRRRVQASPVGQMSIEEIVASVSVDA